MDNSGQPQTSTNANIFNGVTGCSDCVPPDGGMGMWNSAQGTHGRPGWAHSGSGVGVGSGTVPGTLFSQSAS